MKQVAICLIPAGSFTMGSNDFYPEEMPAIAETVAAFGIMRDAVSNADFKAFVDATAYVTTAEQPLDPAAYPDIDIERLAAGSLVFQASRVPIKLSDPLKWWCFVTGACWRHPEGPGSTIEDRMNHPVVHVSWHDAQAYADWAKLRLPTEVEWEYAACGGAKTVFPWGETLMHGDRLNANTWHGHFPYENKMHGTGPYTMPVDVFAPNGFGIYNMIGNVWEWTATKMPLDTSSSCCGPNPSINREVGFAVKGGSHLCAPSYCQRYRPSARSFHEADSSASHIGFRCAVDIIP